MIPFNLISLLPKFPANPLCWVSIEFNFLGYVSAFVFFAYFLPNIAIRYTYIYRYIYATASVYLSVYVAVCVCVSAVHIYQVVYRRKLKLQLAAIMYGP